MKSRVTTAKKSSVEYATVEPPMASKILRKTTTELPE